MTGAHRDRVWLTNPQDDGMSYVVRIERDGDVVGWQSCYLGGVLDLVSDQAYAEFIGEDADTVTVYALTEVGPVPCTVKTTRHAGAGFNEHQVTWRDPGKRGRAAYLSESGYTKIIDA